MIGFNPVATTRRNVTVVCVKKVDVSFENIQEFKSKGNKRADALEVYRSAGT
jgi:hypothetical protein